MARDNNLDESEFPKNSKCPEFEVEYFDSKFTIHY